MLNANNELSSILVDYWHLVLTSFHHNLSLVSMQTLVHLLKFNCPIFSLNLAVLLSVGAAVYAIMEFCLQNSLTCKAICELLKLLQILYVSPKRLPKSVFILKRFSNTLIQQNIHNAMKRFLIVKKSVKAVSVLSHQNESFCIYNW